MVILQQLLMCIVFISTVSHCQSQYESCTSDYKTLESALRNASQNVFLLETVFFPPHKDTPVYITVTYSFSTTSVDYIWSTATIYLDVHPTIISYLSLFFSYIETNRVVHLELQLPDECSDLANNTKSDGSNFLFVLTHRLRHYSQGSTDLEDISAQIVAAENRKHHHEAQNVVFFFSLIIGLPAAIFILVWISVRGAFPYIRSHINDSDSFPRVAALYWIGLTFTFFVIVMDVTALAKNGAFEERDTLEHYQFMFLLFIAMFEILGFFLSFLLALIPLFSHAKNPTCKALFQGYYATLCCGMSFKQIGRKEARVWLLLSSLITPIMALSSHAGFIIGGWVSYRDRSIAIFLLYLFIFVFLYWSLQYMYKFSASFVNHTIRKGHNYCHKLPCFKRLSGEPVCYNARRGGNIQDGEGGDPEGGGTSERGSPPEGGTGDTPNNSSHTGQLGVNCEDHEDEERIDGIIHYEDELSSNFQKTKQVGFDTVAMFFMLFLLIFLYGVLFYFCLGLVLPLLSSIDEALVHIFSLGQHATVIIVFLLTYKVFTTGGGGGGIQRLVSNEALKYWKFLNSGYQKNTHIAALQRAMYRLDLTLKACKKEDRCVHTKSLKKKEFDLKMVGDYLDQAKKSFNQLSPTSPGSSQQPTISSFLRATERLIELLTNPDQFKSETFKSDIQQVENWIKHLSVDKRLNDDEKQGVQKLCAGINHFRNTLVRILGLPPMYLNRDKANALTAALIYRKVSTSQLLQQEQVNLQQPMSQNQLGHPEDNERYSLLLSLIEEDF